MSNWSSPYLHAQKFEVYSSGTYCGNLVVWRNSAGKVLSVDSWTHPDDQGAVEQARQDILKGKG